MNKYIIHADGGSRGNPGVAGAGAIIHDENGEAIISVSKFLGIKTNNYAEYTAVILALEELIKIVGDKISSTNVLIKMDSELVVKQMKGIYKVKHPVLKELNAVLNSLVNNFQNVSFNHIPRAENSEADALANLAMDRGE